MPGPLDIVDELRAAMTAHVVEATELVRKRPHDEDRLTGDVADDVVAGARELLGTARADPVTPPDPLPFAVVDVPAGVVAPFERGAGAPGAVVFTESVERASVGLHIDQRSSQVVRPGYGGGRRSR